MIAEVFKSERAEFHYCSLGILWSVLLAPNGNCFASILVFHLFFCFSHWCNIHVQPRGGWHFFFLSLLLISLVLFLFLLPFCDFFSSSVAGVHDADCSHFSHSCVCPCISKQWRFNDVFVWCTLLSIPACLQLHFVLMTRLHLLHISWINTGINRF